MKKLIINVAKYIGFGAIIGIAFYKYLDHDDGLLIMVMLAYCWYWFIKESVTEQISSLKKEDAVPAEKPEKEYPQQLILAIDLDTVFRYYGSFEGMEENTRVYQRYVDNHFEYIVIRNCGNHVFMGLEHQYKGQLFLPSGELNYGK